MQILAQSAQSAVFVKVIIESCIFMLMQCEICVTFALTYPFWKCFVRSLDRMVNGDAEYGIWSLGWCTGSTALCHAVRGCLPMIQTVLFGIRQSADLVTLTVM